MENNAKKNYDAERRVSSDRIVSLGKDECFVFGSNAQGNHAGGAAAYAAAHFGAEWGVGEGLTGRCYALPTMGTFEEFETAVMNFIGTAAANPGTKFLVTRVGCGIAGYSEEEVAPMFAPALNLRNVYLPEGWREMATL